LCSKIDVTDKQFGACEDAGVPLACAMSYITCTPILTIKKERKGYGLLNFLEGRITGDPVILIDDLAGSQGTLRKAQATLKALKIPIADQYVTLINKTTNTHPTYLDAQLISLFTCDDFALTWEQYVTKYGEAPNFGYLC
jgi:orotate phosphoribosyltransferase